MSTRASNNRQVRQRKLNPKQPLRIIRESDFEEQPEDESQKHLQQVETGVEKGEEIEYHLQAIINASNAAGSAGKPKAQYIPTPEAVRAKDVNYDELYPKVFKEPATYIRFSSTVEDCIGIPYCMDDADLEYLAKLNDGKDVEGSASREELSQCTEDTFEEVMNFFEETSARLQPYANVDGAPLPTLEEMERSMEEGISADALRWLKPIYKYWVVKKGSRPLMPTIKVRVLDTATEIEDADPYVCFRRREVRQTRKTRGRDAQVVEKLKKLRLELEQARSLVAMVVERERLNKENLEVSRKVFQQRKLLKEVKVAKGITGDKGDDEELLVNQKPVAKPKVRQDSSQQKPPTIRIRSFGERTAPDVDLPLLEDWQREGEAFVQNTIESRKEQHKKWNLHWVDETKAPITPPLEEDDPMTKWAQFPPDNIPYPTPPPSLPSPSSMDKGADVDMQEAPPPPKDVEQATSGAEADDNMTVFHIPGSWPISDRESSPDEDVRKRDCRLRYGRGGRCFLETRKRKPYYQLARGVISDSESDDDDDDSSPEYYSVLERIVFDYRAALNTRPTRPEGAGGQPQQPMHQRQWSGADGSVTAGAVGPHGHPQAAQALQQAQASAAG